MEFPFPHVRPVLSPVDDPLTGRPDPVLPAAGGFTVDEGVMAATAGELAALADAVGSAADMLDCGNGDLGPAGLGAAVTALAQQWRHGLADMRDRIQHMSAAVRSDGAAYAQTEQAVEDSFRTRYGM